MKFTRIFTNLLFAFVVLSLTPLSALADKVNWKPIDPKVCKAMLMNSRRRTKL